MLDYTPEKINLYLQHAGVRVRLDRFHLAQMVSAGIGACFSDNKDFFKELARDMELPGAVKTGGMGGQIQSMLSTLVAAKKAKVKQK